MKKCVIAFLLLLLLPCVQSVGMAQQKSKIHGVKVWLDPTDQDASGKNAQKDPNGNLYALVKVQPAVEGFTFKFRGVPSKAPVVHDDGTWIYVQKDAKVVTISKEGYQPLSNADMSLTLEAGKTYIMNIQFDAEVVSKGYLKFTLDESLSDVPAQVRIKSLGASDDDYSLVGTMSDGAVSTSLINCGRYQYKVTASNYSTAEGVADLLKADETKEIKVSLKPNFGFLAVTDPVGVAGAEIYVNDEKIGTVPYQDKRKWESGEYHISIHKELYKDLNTTFTITNGETTKVEARLKSDGATITLQVDDEQAEIFVDGKSYGKGKWVGPLRAGKYNVECRRENHYPTTTSIEVVADKSDGVQLESPKPITGKLAASSRPETTICVDGEEVGSSPRTIPGLTIGTHTVTFTRPGYKVETREVTIKENETTEVEVELSSMGNVTFDSDPTGAKIWIDGKEMDKPTPYSTEIAAGMHEIRLVKAGYVAYDKQVNVDPSKPLMSLRMKRVWVKSSCFYLQPSLQVGSAMSFGGTLGGYISGFNLEGYYNMGLGKSEEIWWSRSNVMPEGTTYSMTSFGGRIGYGFVVGTRLRFTPQIGAGCVSVSGKDINSGGTAISVSLGTRCEFALTRWLGVSLTPEYGIPVSKKDDLKQLTDVSGKIGGWCGGFNCRFGIDFNF